MSLIQCLAGAFTVLGIIAIAKCMLAKRISAGDYTQCRGLDRLHK